MTYAVRITDRAKSEIDAFVRFVAAERQEPVSAQHVLQAIWDAIPSLESYPHRCPVAPESSFVEDTIRMLLVKRTLLLLYSVDDEHRIVTIEGFRHGRHQPLDLTRHVE